VGASPTLGIPSGAPREWFGLAQAANARVVRSWQQKVGHADGDARGRNFHVRQLP